MTVPTREAGLAAARAALQNTRSGGNTEGLADRAAMRADQAIRPAGALKIDRARRVIGKLALKLRERLGENQIVALLDVHCGHDERILNIVGVCFNRIGKGRGSLPLPLVHRGENLPCGNAKNRRRGSRPAGERGNRLRRREKGHPSGWRSMQQRPTSNGSGFAPAAAAMAGKYFQTGKNGRLSTGRQSHVLCRAGSDRPRKPALTEPMRLGGFRTPDR